MRGRGAGCDVALGELRAPGALMLAAAAVLARAPRPLPLPACPLRTLTGIPCPLCGMTTSVTAAVSLDLRAALAANVAGAVVVVVAVALLARPGFAVVRVPGWLPSAGLLLLWAQQLARSFVL